MTDHPITPPPELMKGWIDAWYNAKVKHANMTEFVAIQAARWGADQELEACCGLLRQQGFDVVDDLRAARRPKPPSLKERALQAWAAVQAGTDDQTAMAVICRALNQLPNE